MDGRTVLASRLGYRITALSSIVPGTHFRNTGRGVSGRDAAAGAAGPGQFAAGVDAIVETQTRVAQEYFEDGSVEAACPPLRALLHIMAHGSYEGRASTIRSCAAMFTRESPARQRVVSRALRVKQERDVALWTRHVAALETARVNGSPWKKCALNWRE